MSSVLARENAVWPKDRRFHASDGTPIAYTVAGAGDRTPIVFLNGWTCSDGYWAGIGPGVMAGGRRAVFVDTRAHGESGLPRNPGLCAHKLRREDVSVERLARDLLETLDDAGIGSAALAGHSMGVQTLFEAYRLAPDRVAALIPIAGTYENPVKTFADLAVLDRLYPIAEQLFRVVPFELMRPLLRRTANPDLGLKVVKLIHVAGPKVTAEALAPHLAQVGDTNFSVLFKMMSEMRRHSTAELLPEVQAPLLVLAGRKDVFTPPSVQERMAELVPDAEIVWFDEGGHMLPIEEPAGCVEAINDFLDRRVDRRQVRPRRASSRGASPA